MSPDVQPVAKGVGWSVGARTYGSAFRRCWSKIDGQHYRDVLLTQNLLPVIRQYTDFKLSAGWGTRSPMVELLIPETPDFIPPSLWPPNSPDLNPADYTISISPAISK